MITYRKAAQLLAPGEVVYTTDGKRVIECVVEAIHSDSVITDQDVLFFDEHGYTWWLTEKAVII